MSNLSVTPASGRRKPPRAAAPYYRLLDVRVSAGLSGAARYLHAFVRANPDAALRDCHRALCVAVGLTLGQVPDHVTVDAVRSVLEPQEARHARV